MLRPIADGIDALQPGDTLYFDSWQSLPESGRPYRMPPGVTLQGGAGAALHLYEPNDFVPVFVAEGSLTFRDLVIDKHDNLRAPRFVALPDQGPARPDDVITFDRVEVDDRRPLTVRHDSSPSHIRDDGAVVVKDSSLRSLLSVSSLMRLQVEDSDVGEVSVTVPFSYTTAGTGLVTPTHRITGSEVGTVLLESGMLVVRDSTLTGRGYLGCRGGTFRIDAHTDWGAAADFGTATDPGGNVLRNCRFGATDSGGASLTFWQVDDIAQSEVPAVGNLWGDSNRSFPIVTGSWACPFASDQARAMSARPESRRTRQRVAWGAHRPDRGDPHRRTGR